MTDQRARLARTVTEVPGIHFNALVRRLDLAPGQVQYHLRRLLREGTLAEEQFYGRTHYYPPEYDGFQRGAIALFRRETARGILMYLLDNGPTDPETAADALDVARSTLEWHLDHLVEQDLVRKRRDERNRVTLVLSAPTDTLRLLAEIDPSLPDRLVDRFTRLVDQLLSD